MSGGSKTTTQQQTSSNTVDPAQMALYNANYANAQKNAGTLTPYTGQLTAGFTPTQTQAQGILSGVATNPTYQNANNSALSQIQGVLGSAANQNTTVTPQTLATTDLSPYMNPYTNDVINASIAQNERARQIANTNDNQQATAAGAFGGSRSAVLNALTNEGYDRNDQQNIAGLNQANYAQAQSAAGTDIANNLNAQQSSINNALSKYGLQLNAAGQLVSTGNNALNTALTQGGILSSVGDAQQAQQQAEDTNAYNEFLRQQGFGAQQQQILNSALGIIPVQQTVSSNGTATQKTSGGLTGILGGLLSLGQGAANLGWAPRAPA